MENSFLLSTPLRQCACESERNGLSPLSFLDLQAIVLLHHQARQCQRTQRQSVRLRVQLIPANPPIPPSHPEVAALVASHLFHSRSRCRRTLNGAATTATSNAIWNASIDEIHRVDTSLSSTVSLVRTSFASRPLPATSASPLVPPFPLHPRAAILPR